MNLLHGPSIGSLPPAGPLEAELLEVVAHYRAGIGVERDPGPEMEVVAFLQMSEVREILGRYIRCMEAPPPPPPGSLAEKILVAAEPWFLREDDRQRREWPGRGFLPPRDLVRTIFELPEVKQVVGETPGQWTERELDKCLAAIGKKYGGNLAAFFRDAGCNL